MYLRFDQFIDKTMGLSTDSLTRAKTKDTATNSLFRTSYDFVK